MSHYPLRSRQTTSVVPATPGMDSPLSEMSDNGAVSALGSITPPAASREPAAELSELRESSTSHATAEAGKFSLPSEEPDGVETQGTPERETSEDKLSYENVLDSQIEDDSDTSDTSSTSGTSVSLLDDLEMHTIRFANQDDKKEKLTKEQVKTVQAAEQSMTVEQRDILRKHCNSLTKEKGREHPPSPSPTPGLSSAIAKGKFVDHNLEIDDSELDPEAQREALETWNQVRDINEEVEAHSSDPEHGFQAVKKKHRKSKGKEDAAVKSKSKQQKCNRFEVLEVEETSDDDNSDEVESTVKPHSHHKTAIPQVQILTRPQMSLQRHQILSLRDWIQALVQNPLVQMIIEVIDTTMGIDPDADKGIDTVERPSII
ncbi:hypothetical protein IW261DRAFT_1612499 [Armillaria novae-zelandiae]|uniref:Uncharacterized protein n=1 Tax=Armillaria novae-zelandiae TaxID=153914 RepID=A0AA39NRW0_9AGAR|nr:hypothetical protein IW261DRAFT_1612499 [Armillaria novae-zelandiae]